MSKRAKLIILSCAVALAVVTIGSVVFMVWPFVSSSDINSEIARLKKQGKPVSESDLAQPDIPDSDNAAILYSKAFKLLPTDRERMRSIWVFLRQDSRTDPAVWAEARKLVGQCDRALAVAGEAAERSRCRFGAELSSGMGRGFSRTYWLRDIARIAAARAILRARDGKMALATQDIRLTMSCAQALRDEPMLSPMLTRVSLLRTTSAAVEGCANYGRIPAAEGKELYDALGRLDLRSDFGSAMDGERAFTLDMFDRSAKEGLSWLDSEDPKSEPGKLGRSAAGKQLQRIMARVDERYYLRQMAKQMHIARLPYRVIKWHKLDAEALKDAPKFALLSTISLPAVQRAAAGRDLGIASIAAARIVLALDAYVSRFGSYPRTLDELRSKLGWRIEPDPFSDKDFVYKRQPHGYLLYSVGPNLKDDGGKVRDYFDGRRSGRNRRAATNWRGYSPYESWRQEGDVVWRVERRQL